MASKIPKFPEFKSKDGSELAEWIAKVNLWRITVIKELKRIRKFSGMYMLEIDQNELPEVKLIKAFLEALK